MAKKLPKRANKLKLPNFQIGGVVEDPMGQWKYPGEVTRIPSNRITMKGVDYPVLGVSDSGHTQMMQPGGEYKFKGSKVTEYPMAELGLSQEMQVGGSVLTYAGTGDIQRSKPTFKSMQAGGVAPLPVTLQERQNWNDFARYAHTDPNFGNPEYYDKNTQYGYNKLQEYNKTHPDNLIRTPEDVGRVQQAFTQIKSNPGQYGYAGNWSSGKDLKQDQIIGTQTSSTLFPSVSEQVNTGKTSTTTNYGQDYEKWQAAHPATLPVKTAPIQPQTNQPIAMNQLGSSIETENIRNIRMAQNGTGLSGPVLHSGPNVKNSAPPSPVVTKAPSKGVIVNNTFPMQMGGKVTWEIV